MRRKMEIDDYIALYPVMTASEIRKEFKEFSHSESNIRRTYQDMKLGNQSNALKIPLKLMTFQFV